MNPKYSGYLKYDSRIDDAILDALSNNNTLQFMELYHKICHSYKKISLDAYNSHIKYLLWKYCIDKNDSGKRGTRVYYFLTDKMKQMQRLKILNFQEEGKREIIYLVIFFLSVYTYYPFQSEQQLEEFLSDARLSLADLVQVGSREIDRDGKHFIVKNFEASPHIGVSRYEEIGPNNDIQSVSYRVGLAGKSPTEILDQSGRVFQHINVTRTEMEEAFRIAKYEGLIKRVMVFRKEGRYEIADERLEDFISDCYELFRLILSKLQIVWKNIRKPNTKEVKWLELFRGRRQADKIRAEAYHYRHSLSKRKKTKIVRQTKEEVKVHEEKINKYWDYIFEKHLETIKKYRFPTEEILRITFPNFLRKSV